MALELPSTDDMLVPMLRAAQELGKPVRYDELDRHAVRLAGLPENVWDVEFDDDASMTGSKMTHRLGWTRSALKRADLLESHGGGVWGISDGGSQMLHRDDVADAVQEAVRTAYSPVEPEPAFFARLREAATGGEPETMTTRSLLAKWGVNRRWASTIERIGDTLLGEGLNTEPDFRQGHLDDEITIVALEPAEPSNDDGAAPLAPGDVITTVRSLPSATRPVTAVSPHDTLMKAQTLMFANDFSQLPVMEGARKLLGAVSWESIARARMLNHALELQDCISKATVVQLDDPLMDVVRSVARLDFVFVRDSQARITGIVTSADLSEQFMTLATPFLLLSEIEALLRSAVERVYSIDELQDAVDPRYNGRTIDGAHSLTLGELMQLLSSRTAWERLGWQFDRTVFVHAFDEVRRIRNEVMHFSPDPLDPSDAHKLEAFLGWMRDLAMASG